MKFLGLGLPLATAQALFTVIFIIAIKIIINKYTKEENAIRNLINTI